MEESIDLRYLLSQEMIDNEYVNDINGIKTRGTRKSAIISNHELVSIPPYTTFKNNQIVQYNTRYIQRQCKGCTKRVRTYCACTPGVMLCGECFRGHQLQRNSSLSFSDFRANFGKLPFSSISVI